MRRLLALQGGGGCCGFCFWPGRPERGHESGGSEGCWVPAVVAVSTPLCACGGVAVRLSPFSPSPGGCGGEQRHCAASIGCEGQCDAEAGLREGERAWACLRVGSGDAGECANSAACKHRTRARAKCSSQLARVRTWSERGAWPGWSKWGATVTAVAIHVRAVGLALPAPQPQIASVQLGACAR